MLAQNFKTPAELKITDAEFGALYQVLGMLERDEIPHHLFDMCIVGEPECGTPGCIKGWARAISGQKFLQLKIPRNLDDLFFPGDSTRHFKRSPYTATPNEAAIALRSYLTHGEARWHEAMAG